MFSKAGIFVVLLGLSLALKAEQAPDAGFCTGANADADQSPLYRQPPVFPHPAILLCLEGTVVVEFTVDREGRVRDPIVLESTQPGLFDRAAIAATKRWLYRPRCEGGQPVEAQQRTALDFLFAEGEREKCLPGTRLLEGEALALAADLGLLYSLVAERQFLHDEADWAGMVQDALRPSFSGALGQIEQFHHQLVEELVAIAQRPAVEHGVLPRQLLYDLANPAPSAEPPDSAALAQVRRNAYEWSEQLLGFSEGLADRYFKLRAELDLDPQLADVLIFGFVGDPGVASEVKSRDLAGFLDRTDRLLDLLEDPARPWQLLPQGISFEDSADQRQFMQLANEFALQDYAIFQNQHQFWAMFADYRP